MTTNKRSGAAGKRQRAEPLSGVVDGLSESELRIEQVHEHIQELEQAAARLRANGTDHEAFLQARRLVAEAKKLRRRLEDETDELDEFAVRGAGDDRSAPSEPAAKKWTPERIAEARAMRDGLRAKGARDYAQQTARHYSVSAAYMRRVLRDDTESRGPAALAGWPPPKTRTRRTR